jgi:RNA polymerase sigma factor (sigma-70 family)
LTAESDADLVRRCLADDASAWVALTERYGDLVFGIARRHGLAPDAASDVVQEVFVALLAGLRRLRNAERLLAWILRAARRESWRQVRRSRARRRREEGVARVEAEPALAPAAAIAAEESRHVVREAYAALGERCRRLLDALFLADAGVPYERIASDLGLAVGSIGSLRRRCLEELRDHLSRLGYDEGA